SDAQALKLRWKFGFQFGVRRSPPLWYFSSFRLRTKQEKIPKRRRSPHSKLKKFTTARLQCLRVGLVSFLRPLASARAGAEAPVELGDEVRIELAIVPQRERHAHGQIDLIAEPGDHSGG